MENSISIARIPAVPGGIRVMLAGVTVPGRYRKFDERVDEKWRVMCGMYFLIWIDDLGNRFRVFNPKLGTHSKFNIAPGTRQPVIIQGGSSRELV